jgi:MFS family permease
MTCVPLPGDTVPASGARPRRAGVVLGRRASLAVSAGVVSHTLWTSAAPALTYGLYAEQWHLTHAVTTAIFAVYPIAVVATLIIFGGISDQIGRRAAMLWGVGASLAGALLFAVAPGVQWIFAGRILMGVGVGLSVGPSTAAVLEFCSHENAKRAALVTITSQAGGFAAGLLVGGALTQYGPWPTRLCFYVLALLLLVLFAAAWFLPRRTIAGENAAWRPRVPSIPKNVRRPFATASIAIMTAYTFGVLVLSLGGQVEHDLIGSSNALLNGAVLTLFPFVLGLVAFAAKVLPSGIALSIGSVASVSGMGLLVIAIGRHDLVAYLAATAAAGAGYSLLFVGGLELINATVPPHHRGGVLSALYLLGYLSMGVVALVLGIVATGRGLGLAVDLGAGAITIMSITTLVLAFVTRADAAE